MPTPASRSSRRLLLALGLALLGAAAIGALALREDEVELPSLAAPAGAAKLPMDQTGAGPVRRLLASDAALTLPERAAAPVQTQFTVTEFRPDPAAEACHTTPLPFAFSRAHERNQPDGMTVTVDGEAVPYHAWSHTKQPGWRISHGELHIMGFDALDAAEIDYPNLAARADRFEPATAGLEPADFASFRYAAGPVSRRGLLLPAPATAAWEVTVEPGQRLEAAVALAVPPGLERASDGVYAVLRFREGEAITELGRTFVGPTSWLKRQLNELEVAAEDPYVDWVVPLEAVAGRTGALELVAEVSGTEVQDYLFVAHPTIASPATAAPRHVIVVGLDTTRPDHLGLYGYEEPTTPHLDAWAEHAAVFDWAWTPAPRTRPSFRSSTTGRYPLTAVGAPNIGEVFADNGFATAGIVANVHLNPRFEFDRGFDLWHLDPKAIVDAQVDMALEWLDAHRHRDAYLFLHIIDPHLFYKPPAEYAARFVTDPDPDLPVEFNRWSVARMTRNGELSEQRKAHIRALYDGEIAFTDAELGRLFDGVEAMGTQTLVVVHSDHGEELWEHGEFEHNHALWDEVTKAVLAIRPPDGTDGPVRSDVPATLADIAPTLYDYLGFAEVPPSDGISLRPYVEGAAVDEAAAARPIGTAHLMYEREQWAVVADKHKYIVTTATGEEELYDLVADPGETTNLAADTELGPFRAALSAAHLDMPVGPGWIGDFALTEPIAIVLPHRAEAAGVYDPEALRSNRANLAWGEKPPHAPVDAATVRLAESGDRVFVEPGTHGRGAFWVRFTDELPTRGARFARDGESLRGMSRRGRTTWERGREHIVLRTGTVLDTPLGEAARMALQGDAAGEEVELLEALGYLGTHAHETDGE